MKKNSIMIFVFTLLLNIQYYQLTAFADSPYKNCPRLSNMEDVKSINSIFDCFDQKIKDIALNKRENRSNTIEKGSSVISGVKVEARSAKLEKENDITKISVTIFLTNTTEKNILALIKGPPAIAVDSNNVTFEVKSPRDVGGLPVCTGGSSLQEDTEWCIKYNDKKKFTSLASNSPVMFTLTFSPQFPSDSEISSDFVTISFTLLIFKNNNYEWPTFTIEKIQVED